MTHTSPSDEYELYVERCARNAPEQVPLSREEFVSLLERLDDLYVSDIERHLGPEEKARLRELRRVLCEDLQNDGDRRCNDDGGATTHLAERRPRTSRMGAPCPDAENRRKLWLEQRRQGDC